MSTVVDADMFAMALTDLLKDVTSDVETAASKAVSQSTRKGVTYVKREAEKGGLHKWSDRYVSGFGSHLDKGSSVTTGEIGNRNKPGLVHLLEKGHATLNGRRTNAYPHMAPAYENIERDLIDRLEDAVGYALGGS